jgi:hypothetical protein
MLFLRVYFLQSYLAMHMVNLFQLAAQGLTVFRGIQAIDRDKPNTPNSDVQYSIVDGNDKGKFAMESSHRAVLVLRRPLDYDAGDREFNLTLMASVICAPLLL